MEANAIVEEMLNKTPLIGFSLYTEIHSKIVQKVGGEILACFDAGITPDDGSGKGIICGGEVISRGYGQFWLWLLGAYEVVRTMCQAEECFSPRVAAELKAFKRHLADLRMPFAKQELHGKSVPVQGEPSIAGIEASPPDLRFLVGGQLISARTLIGEFDRIFATITRADILADHRSTF